ncbi:MAG: SAM-dependent methyltransferase [Spirochaetia bacterium]|jgi:methyltransferase (TIGR00027 family)
MSKRRIESRASKTADMTCGCRALSSMEKNPLYKSDDWVAAKLLPRKIQLIVRIPPARKMLARVFGPQGVYEWVIARTRYIDEVMRRALAEGFSQVLIFGAGFDSRAIRFQAQLGDCRVFELDAPTTQAMKIGQLQKRGVVLPPNLVFVPVNFEKETAKEKLSSAGFHAGAKTLAILEGVLQYLKPDAAEETLRTVAEHVGTGSWLVFDYAHASVLRGEGSLYGEERMTRGVSRFGESWQFGLEENEVEPFLRKYRFSQRDRRSPRQLEEMCFQDEKGVIVGRVNGTQSIVWAEKQ